MNKLLLLAIAGTTLTYAKNNSINDRQTLEDMRYLDSVRARQRKNKKYSLKAGHELLTSFDDADGVENEISDNLYPKQ